MQPAGAATARAMYCPTCHGPRAARTAWEAYGREIAVTVDPPDEFGQFRAEFSVGGKVRYEAFFTDKSGAAGAER